MSPVVRNAHLCGNAQFSLGVFPANLRPLPVTVALIAGPMVDVVYHMANTSEAEVGGFSIAQVIRALLCLLMFASLYGSSWPQMRLPRVILPIVLLALYAVLTGFLQTNPYENIVYSGRIVFLILVYLSVYIFTRAGLIGERWLLVVGWSVLLLTIASQLAGYFLGISVEAYKSDYASAGLTATPSVTAAAALAVAPIFLRNFRWCGKSVLAVTLLILSILATMRRSAFLTVLAALGVTVLLVSKSHKKRFGSNFRLLLSITLISVVLFLVLAHTPMGEDFCRRMTDLNLRQGGTGSGRIIFWKVALNHIMVREFNSNILGDGIGTIRTVMRDRFGAAIDSHSDWLGITVAFGFVGFALFAWWHMEIWRLAVRLYKTKAGGSTAAVAAFVIIFLYSLATGGVLGPAFAPVFAVVAFGNPPARRKKPKPSEFQSL